MVVTRRRAAPQPEAARTVRRAGDPSGGGPAPGRAARGLLSRFDRRRQERWALIAVAVLGVLGLWLVTGRSLESAFERGGEAAAAEAAREVESSGGATGGDAGSVDRRPGPVDLNRVASVEEIIAVMGAWSDPRERQFVAERILAARDDAGGLRNVGALAALEVPVRDVVEASYPRLMQRVPADFSPAAADSVSAAAPADEDSATSASAASEEATMRLLGNADLRRLKPLLSVRSSAEFATSVRLWSALILLGLCALHLLWCWQASGADPWLLPSAGALVMLGLVMMIAVRDPLRDWVLLVPFAQGVVGGLVLCGIAAAISWERAPLRRVALWALPAALLLSLLLLLFGTGPGTSDAKVNLFGFQPVEAIKLLVVVFLAGYFADRWELLREVEDERARAGRLPRWFSVPRLQYLLPPIVAMAMVLVFFFLQKDLGPSLVLSGLFLGLYAATRRRFGMVAVAFGILLCGFWVGYQLGVPATVRGRIEMWLSPWDNAFRGGDHLAHSLWAFASGGLFGRGLGRGEPGFVPEAHTDMILAAVGEELGGLGVLAVLVLYGVIVWRALLALRRAAGAFSWYLGLGLVLVFALQIVLIVGGVTGVLPLSGVVTPFLSYGRSAMLANFAALGVLLAITAQATPPGGDEVRSTGHLRGALLPVGLFLTLCAAGLAAKVVWMQWFHTDEIAVRPTLTLQADGVRRATSNPRLLALARRYGRGSIVDRNGLVLATSARTELEQDRPTYEQDLGLDFTRFERSRAADERLYPLGGRAFHVLGDLNRRTGWGAPNSSYLERDDAATLLGWSLSGEEEVAEFTGDSAETRGLSALLPLLRYGWDSGHRTVRALRERDRTLRSTLDARLQVRAAELLAQRVQRADAERGAAVVLDVETGEVLTLVAVPWPDRERLDRIEEPMLLDRARYGLYPPGSTFKLVTAMAAVRAGEDDRTYRCGRLPDGRVGAAVEGWGRPVRDDPRVKTPHGRVDLDRGIAVSCNAYFAQLAVNDLGSRQLLEVAAEFGIDVAAPNTPEKLGDALPQAAYGQGQVTATPLEMARVAATVASGGLLTKTRWLQPIGGPPRATDPTAAAARRPEARRLLEQQDAERLARAMRLVVVSGSAARALSQVSPAIAGKTGTAEVAGRKSHAWFVGFAPYGGSGRRIAFAVVIEQGGYGGVHAAGAAGEIVQAAARLGVL